MDILFIPSFLSPLVRNECRFTTGFPRRAPADQRSSRRDCCLGMSAAQRSSGASSPLEEERTAPGTGSGLGRRFRPVSAGRCPCNEPGKHDGSVLTGVCCAYLHFNRLRVEESGNLVITKLAASDEGRYVCVAQNIVGVRETSPVQLTVRSKFIFSSGSSKKRRTFIRSPLPPSDSLVCFYPFFPTSVGPFFS